MPRFFYFDLGNVLLNFDHRRGARQMAAAAGVDEAAAWNAVFASDLQDRYESGDVSCAEFCDAFAAATGSTPDREKLMEAGGAIFEANVPMFPIVAALQAAGLRTGILSNTCKCHWDWCVAGRFGLIPGAFEQIVLSFEERSMKPRAQIYEAAIERAGVTADEIFFVDDREENVAAARTAGIDAVLFRGAADCARELRRRGVAFNY